MSQSISLKAAMTITTGSGLWVHESAWESNHAAFAENCSCFSVSPLQRRAWVSAGGRGRPAPLGTGFTQCGRWVFQKKDTKDIIAAVSLEWDESLFTIAWFDFEDRQSILTGDTNPALWLIEAIVQRLVPDAVTIHGSSVVEALKELGERKTIAIPHAEHLKKDVILRFDREAWKTYPGTAIVRKELDWVRKQVARENRVEEFARKPQKRPWLLRVLLAMSPMRRRRSGKMVHPIDRLKTRLNS